MSLPYIFINVNHMPEGIVELREHQIVVVVRDSITEMGGPSFRSMSCSPDTLFEIETEKFAVSRTLALQPANTTLTGDAATAVKTGAGVLSLHCVHSVEGSEELTLSVQVEVAKPKRR